MNKKYHTINELIQFLEAERNEINERIEALKSPRSIFEEELILKYIETRSTVKTAEYIKSIGIKSSKGTVFSASDVSEIIKSNNKSITPALLRIAKDIFNKNTTSVVRAYG